MTVTNTKNKPLAGTDVAVPCTATSFDLFTGSEAVGQVCADATTDASGMVAEALLPAPSADVVVTPPKGYCKTTVHGLSVQADSTITIQLPRASCATISESGFGPTAVSAKVGGVVQWDNAGTAVHSIVDSTGMGLFDSGPMAPGDSFTFSFPSAGVYSLRDQDSSFAGSVKVAPSASPQSGDVTTAFTITWSAAPPEAGFAFDVQVKRPGSSTWSTWRTGTSAVSAGFEPDAGAGTYAFHTRLRKLSDGTASKWSPSVSLTVSARRA